VVRDVGGEKYRADVLREEFAPYDISNLAYKGSYRYRRDEDLDEEEEQLPKDMVLYVCGSWSGWQHLEQMEQDADGWWISTFLLGETLCEFFYIAVNTKAHTIHPAIERASQNIWVCGPDAHGAGKHWMVDCRGSHTKSTTFKVKFWWSDWRKRVEWEEVTDFTFVPEPLAFKHRYSMVGSWTSWACVDMELSEDAWHGSFRLGSSGREEFHFVRDHDSQQAIYPAKAKASDMGIPVRGPDHLGEGKHWEVRGCPGELVYVKLRVNADVSMDLSTGSGISKSWESRGGWGRHQYYVKGTINSGQSRMLTMDSSAPGIFRCRVPFGQAWTMHGEYYMTNFRISVDNDARHFFYPEIDLAGSGESVVKGPDQGGKTYFAVTSVALDDAFEVTLNLITEDRRKTVTFVRLRQALSW